MKNMNWYLYIVKCKDNSLYTGITTDIKRRVLEHNADDKKRAKSLRGKLPVYLVYWEKFNNRADASKREREIKGWNKKKKLELIAGLP